MCPVGYMGLGHRIEVWTGAIKIGDISLQVVDEISGIESDHLGE